MVQTLQNTQITSLINSLNDHINSANISCPPNSECYKKKETATLKNAYLQAEYTLKDAPNNFKTAKKNYITYVDGEASYNEMNKNEIEKEAIANAKDKIKLFIDNWKLAVNNNLAYSTTIDSASYINEVLINITQNNLNLQNNVNNTSDDILTNDRKSYYEQENYDNLKWWYNFWLYIYIFLLIVFTIAIFIGNSEYTIMSKVGILILFIAYIFIMKPIFLFVVYIIRTINSFLPKNIYLSIN
jgi:hypothetical protein